MFHWRSKTSNKKSDRQKRLQSIENATSTSMITAKPNLVSDENNPKPNSSSNKWEQVLDQEFRSLDIDADGYVSRADLQCVLR